MTLPLLVLIHGEDFLIQFFPVMPSNVPIFEKQLQNLDELLGFAGIDVNDEIYILFHVSTDIAQAANPIQNAIFVGRDFVFD